MLHTISSTHLVSHVDVYAHHIATFHLTPHSHRPSSDIHISMLFSCSPLIRTLFSRLLDHVANELLTCKVARAVAKTRLRFVCVMAMASCTTSGAFGRLVVCRKDSNDHDVDHTHKPTHCARHDITSCSRLLPCNVDDLGKSVNECRPRNSPANATSGSAAQTEGCHHRRGSRATRARKRGNKDTEGVENQETGRVSRTRLSLDRLGNACQVPSAWSRNYCHVRNIC